MRRRGVRSLDGRAGQDGRATGQGAGEVRHLVLQAMWDVAPSPTMNDSPHAFAPRMLDNQRSAYTA